MNAVGGCPSPLILDIRWSFVNSLISFDALFPLTVLSVPVVYDTGWVSESICALLRARRVSTTVFNKLNFRVWFVTH